MSSARTMFQGQINSKKVGSDMPAVKKKKAGTKKKKSK